MRFGFENVRLTRCRHSSIRDAYCGGNFRCQSPHFAFLLKILPSSGIFIIVNTASSGLQLHIHQAKSRPSLKRIAALISYLDIVRYSIQHTILPQLILRVIYSTLTQGGGVAAFARVQGRSTYRHSHTVADPLSSPYRYRFVIVGS